MIEPIKRLSVDVIPQAIVGLPVGKIAQRWEHFSEGSDDLDFYEGASFRLDNKIEIAVRHYRGHPSDTTTIYIDCRERDVEHITRLIRKIMKELRIPEETLRWERRQIPISSFSRCGRRASVDERLASGVHGVDDEIVR